MKLNIKIKYKSKEEAVYLCVSADRNFYLTHSQIIKRTANSREYAELALKSLLWQKRTSLYIDGNEQNNFFQVSLSHKNIILNEDKSNI